MLSAPAILLQRSFAIAQPVRAFLRHDAQRLRKFRVRDAVVLPLSVFGSGEKFGVLFNLEKPFASVVQLHDNSHMKRSVGILQR